MAAAPVIGEYKNNVNNNAAIGNDNLATDNDKYYTANFGTNTNVEEHAVPSYWQANITANVNEDVNYEKGFRIDSNKRFVKYFIVEVDCSHNQEGQTSKETDLIYFSVERKG